MKTVFVLSSILFLTSCNSAAVVLNLPKYTRISDVMKEDLRRRLEEANGCNANICFAIDGSSDIDAKEFESEKNFVLDVASVVGVDEPSEMAAVQYATSITKVQPLTSNSALFIEKVNDLPQMKGQSFMVGGINYCYSQLYKKKDEAIKIVILGNGKGTIGSRSVNRAKEFIQIGGDISVVGAGFTDDAELLAIAGGRQDHVFRVNSFLDVLDLETIMETLILQIC